MYAIRALNVHNGYLLIALIYSDLDKLRVNAQRYIKRRERGRKERRNGFLYCLHYLQITFKSTLGTE